MNDISQLEKELKRKKQEALENANSKEDVIEIWKQDKRKSIPNNKKQFFCAGCRNNDYNFGLGGAKECWSLKSAKLKEREIYSSLDSIKPNKVITLSCFMKRYH